MFITLVLKYVESRESTILYTSSQGTGDCFQSICSFNEAMLTLKMADIIHVKDNIVYPPSYPSEFSDLIEGVVQSNITLVGNEGNTVIDGRYLTGGVMYYLENQRRFTWGKFKHFTFKNFNKLIMSRQHTWSTYPQVVFEDCIFENCSSDLFSTSGGVWVFIRCTFKNINGRPFKSVSETQIEYIDCNFENIRSAIFVYGSDLMVRNCIFTHCFGGRGGAIYARKSTVYIKGSKFINCEADANGGAIYIRDSLEDYQSEVSDCCFLNNKAKMKGNSLYLYLSSVIVKNNTFSGSYTDDLEVVSSETIGIDTSRFSSNPNKCIEDHKPLDLPDQFFPCDTYQNNITDDMHGNIYLDFSNPEDPLEDIIG